MKEWKIKSKRKDPHSGMRCKICKGIPTRWYKLMSTTIYRCEEHKTMIVSPVYDQGKISSRGELIGMEVNPTFEVGISRVVDYESKSGHKIDPKKMNEEMFSCKSCPSNIIERNDPDFEQKVKDLVDTHIRKEHPLLFSYSTYYDEKGEHNLFIEHPDEFYLTQLSHNEVTEHFSKAIPRDLVGTDISAEQIKSGIL